MNVISYLRSRPVHERRILAVSAYAAMAAVVVAAWVVSFRNTLTWIPNVGAPTTVAPAGEPTSPAAGSLRTPFQTLSETWRETTEQLKAGLAAAERIGGSEKESKATNQESGEGDTLGTPMGEAGITIRYLAEGEVMRPGAPQETLEPESVNQESRNAPPSAARTELIAPIVVDRLANATAHRAVNPKTEPLLEPGGERRGFFRALSSVLAAFVRSLDGLVR